jgi:hypothetical protein
MQDSISHALNCIKEKLSFGLQAAVFLKTQN